MAIRKIIHIDMDAFFAAIEQRDYPELRGKPIAIGSPSGRGVVATASYEARKFGIHSALPSSTALKRCPSLIFIPPRFDVYKEVSLQIMEIFREYTDLVEPLSIDEAFLDVTYNKKEIPSATLIANAIRKQIFDETQLTASAGISINKFLAKIASDQNKPNGIYIIKPEEVIPFIENLKIEKFFGVGKKTTEKMHKLGIFSGKELKAWSPNGLTKHFGKAGAFFYKIAQGIDDRPVVSSRERKSVGIEDTFNKDLTHSDEINTILKQLNERLWIRLQNQNKRGKTLTLKIKFNDFEQITRSKTKLTIFTNQQETLAIASALFAIQTTEKPIRLIGLTISNFDTDKPLTPFQLTIDFD